jgi:hypothetical protein
MLQKKTKNINIYLKGIYIFGQLVIHLFVPPAVVWPAVDQIKGGFQVPSVFVVQL